MILQYPYCKQGAGSFIKYNRTSGPAALEFHFLLFPASPPLSFPPHCFLPVQGLCLPVGSHLPERGAAYHWGMLSCACLWGQVLLS